MVGPHFKLEDYRSVLKLLQPNYYMCSLDLKDAYFVVNVHPKSRKFLRLSFEGNLWQFTCLPFGLCTSPFIFSKMLKPILSLLRHQGILCVNYLDDFVILSNTKDNCAKSTAYVIDMLKNLGFVINEKKSSLSPSRICTFLGFVYDTTSMTLQLPSEKKKQNP